MDTQFFQDHMLERLSYPHCSMFEPICELMILFSINVKSIFMLVLHNNLAYFCFIAELDTT